MSDSNALFSYFTKLVKENLAKLIFYVIAIILGISFLKWLIFGGFTVLFTAFFSLIGLGDNDKDVIRNQEVVITQIQEVNKINTETIDTLIESRENLEESLQNHYEGKEKQTQAFDTVIDTGKNAFNDAYKPSKKKKEGGSSHTAKKPVDGSSPEPDTATEVNVLDDPQSPQSLQLAKAQVDMVFGSFCLASPASCS